MANGAKKKLGSGRHISAIKRNRQNAKRKMRNKGCKAALRTAVKKFKEEPNAETLKKTASVVDKAASKGVIPKRRASRIISKLARSATAST